MHRLRSLIPRRGRGRCAGTRPFWQCGTTYHVGLDWTHTHMSFTTCEFSEAAFRIALCCSVSGGPASTDRLCPCANATPNLRCCRRRTLWSISQSTSIICDARSAATDIRSDPYASYDVSTNVWTGISFAILSTRVPIAILSAVGCDYSILSCYAARSCKAHYHGT